MKSFIQRLFGGQHSNSPTKPEAPWAVGDPNVLNVTLVSARRPLVSSIGAVVGFEFRIPDDIQQRISQGADMPSQAAHVSAVLTSARLTALAGRVGFARCPMDWLGQASNLEDVAGIMVALESAAMDPDLRAATAHLVKKMRSAGATVGWDAATDLGLTPDFLMLRQGLNPMAAVLEGFKTWPTRLRILPILVTDIGQVQDLEQALLNGVNWACGALAPTGGEGRDAGKQPVPPAVRRITKLLNQLVAGVETPEIVQEIKSDVGMSYRLLRRMNSASLAQIKAGASIEHAVMMLGRNELYRWMSILLLQYADSRKASSALQDVALWRSRFLELLAIENHEEAPGQFFTVGLASMLGEILRITMVDVVEMLNLPPKAREALLYDRGPWHLYLQVINQVEGRALPAASSDRFGGAARVHALSDEAWTWATTAAQDDREGV